MGVELFCCECRKKYRVNEYRRFRSKYCSLICKSKVGGRIGGRAGRGISRNSGRKRPDLSLRNKENPMIGAKNPNWKGKGALYAVKHIWVRKHFGCPQQCEKCGVKNRKVGKKKKINYIQWANISGRYFRKRSDWLFLCPCCHYQFDIKKQRSASFKRRI